MHQQWNHLLHVSHCTWPSLACVTPHTQSVTISSEDDDGISRG